MSNGMAHAETATLQQQVVELQSRLAASEGRERVMRQLLDNLPSAIYATGKDGVVAVVNTAFAA